MDPGRNIYFQVGGGQDIHSKKLPTPSPPQNQMEVPYEAKWQKQLYFLPDFLTIDWSMFLHTFLPLFIKQHYVQVVQKYYYFRLIIIKK